MLNQNAIIIIDVNGNILREPNGIVPSEPNANVLREPIGSFRANSNYTSSITVIAPFELDSVVSANYSKKNRRNDDIAQFLIPNGNKKGKDIIGENDPLYQLVYDWHVFEADVPQLAVAYFAKYRSDMLFVSIGVENIVKPAKAITYKGEFGIDNLLPEEADNGDYYISKNYNFMDKNIQWTLNDYAYYDNGWKKSNYRGEAFTDPIEILVDPAIEANYEIQEDLDLSVLLAGRLAIVESSVIQLGNTKQNKLIAGENITIDPNTNVISSSGGNSNEPDGVTIVLNEDDKLEVNLKYIMNGGYL